MDFEDPPEEADFWLARDQADGIIRLADKIGQDYATSRIISLGQSPAWIVHSIELLNVARGGQPIATGYLPFSDQFLSTDNVDTPHRSYRRNNHLGPDEKHRLPTKAQLSHFRKLLTANKLDPASIVEMAEKEGVKTTILEITVSGKGLASFLDILLSWAREQGNENRLRSALNIVPITPPENPLETITIQKSGLAKILCRPVILAPLFKRRLLNPPSNARLVPHYPPSEWGNRLNYEGNERIIAQTAALLREALDSYTPLPIVVGTWRKTGETVAGREKPINGPLAAIREVIRLGRNILHHERK